MAEAVLNTIQYVHGLKDSTDLDVVYVFGEMPPESKCIRFCAEDPSENRNIIVIRDGQVAECCKGFPDENNNALLTTYPLHEQSSPLLITHRVPIDIFLKSIVVVRKILMMIRRTQDRKAARDALKGFWQEKLRLIGSFELCNAQWQHWMHFCVIWSHWMFRTQAPVELYSVKAAMHDGMI